METTKANVGVTALGQTTSKSDSSPSQDEPVSQRSNDVPNRGFPLALPPGEVESEIVPDRMSHISTAPH